MSAICVCTTAYADTTTTTRNGTYTTDGTALAMRDYSGYTADRNYCVLGNTLHVVGVAATTGGMRGGVGRYGRPLRRDWQRQARAAIAGGNPSRTLG